MCINIHCNNANKQFKTFTTLTAFKEYLSLSVHVVILMYFFV